MLSNANVAYHAFFFFFKNSALTLHPDFLDYTLHLLYGDGMCHARCVLLRSLVLMLNFDPAANNHFLGLLHHGEGQDFLDTEVVGEEHDHAVNAHAEATCRRKAVFQGLAI
jgi:hypothetical protein